VRHRTGPDVKLSWRRRVSERVCLRCTQNAASYEFFGPIILLSGAGRVNSPNRLRVKVAPTQCLNEIHATHRPVELCVPLFRLIGPISLAFSASLRSSALDLRSPASSLDHLTIPSDSPIVPSRAPSAPLLLAGRAVDLSINLRVNREVRRANAFVK